MGRAGALVGLLALLGVAAKADNFCSLQQGLSCDPAAKCEEDDTHWWCTCPEGSEGDGLKGDDHTGCVFAETPCVVNPDCHHLGYCDLAGGSVCRCKEGFVGDGHRNCTDVDECLQGTCSQYAVCQNSPGNFSCVCDIGYVGDGRSCVRSCDLNHHCGGENNFCNTTTSVCECRDGYEGDGFLGCTDIDECTVGTAECGTLMRCENLNGTYDCPCVDGYFKDDGECKGKPKNCNHIQMRNPKARDDFFEVDPDGPGGVPAFEVYCDFQPEYGITVIFSDLPATETVRRYKQVKTVTYKPTIEQIKALIDSSPFCYQDMRFRCVTDLKLMNGQTYWRDGNGEKHYAWGGATENNKCLCGQLGVCGNPSDACYCNGEDRDREDSGWIFDRSQLPITEVYFGDVKSGQRASLKIGDLKCGPRTIDIAKSCHEYKFSGRYWRRKDAPMFIDVDGPEEGTCPPMLVHCNMERYQNAGVSIFHHHERDPAVVTQPGRIEFNYQISDECLRKAVDNSEFCLQSASYHCKNSRLYNNGDRKGFLGQLNGDPIPFFAGGMGEANMCGCGLNGACDEEAAKCNCDIADDMERDDVGVYTEKQYLPVGYAEFNEIGGSSTGKYSVGPLMCSERQFGIPPSCLAARDSGNTVDYTYLIDPDQGSDIKPKGNVPPFPVFCKFSDVGVSATTIVYHEETVTEAGNYLSIIYNYYRVVREQIDALKKTSAYCFQDITLGCKKAPIHANSLTNFEWTGVNGHKHQYFHGNGNGKGCACNDLKNCTGSLLCNCDKNDDVSRFDYGVFTNMNDIPAAQTELRGLAADSQSQFALGPLTCSENFPTCDQINSKFVPVERAFGTLEDGEFFVDTDGIGPLEPFLVKCAFPLQTILPVNNGEGEGDAFPFGDPICFDVKYSGDVTPAQIQSLVNASAFCEQKVSYLCRNSPFTDKVTYKTCDGREQRGWGDSQGEPGCGCGVTGECDKCHCDNATLYQQRDSGYIRAKHALPVCEVCINADPVRFGDPGRYSKVVIDALICYPDTGHIPGTCQDLRNEDRYHTGVSTVTTEVDVDGRGDAPPLPVKCVLSGLTGVVVIEPQNPVIEIPLEGIEISVLYFFLDFIFIRDVIDQSVYCEQALRIECFDGATFEVTANSAWKGADGMYQEYWAGNTGGIGCKNGICNCGFQDGRERVDGGLLTDQETMPVTGIKLPPSSGGRRVSIGALKCYTVYKDCEDIRKETNGENPPSGGKLWPIDPDGAGGVEPFVVECDFYTHKHMGITVVRTLNTEPQDVTGAEDPGSFLIPVTYLPTPEQINALAVQSEFCYQKVEFTCAATPLLNDNNPTYGYLTGFNNTMSPNFGAGESSEVGICACGVSYTCPRGHSCRCDDKSPEAVLERGIVLKQELFPITAAAFGGQNDPSAYGKFEVGDVLCAPEVFDIPGDCEEARVLGAPTGDTLIRPYRYLPPIMVYCEMRHGFGITITGTSVTNIPGNASYPGTVDVDYTEGSEFQLRTLVRMSDSCYQPVKYDCKNTQFLEKNKAYWLRLGDDNEKIRHWGHANSFERCSCGHDTLCAGTPDEGRSVQRARKCNCDTGDDVWRRDAGIISKDLPISSVHFEGLSPEAEGQVTVGFLYCAPQPFDLDECAIDFHDCAPEADCLNLPYKFECRCRSGFQSWGRDRSKFFSNGRVCYDDDECALNRCGYSARCENTPGSYKCHCKEGYTQEDDHTCTDIDECATESADCDENAICTNVPGSYLCRCKRGYQGTGRQCEEIGICTCFGDPHCRSFDDRWLHFQGACQYTMARDGCDGTAPTFQVLQKNWRRDDVRAIEKEVSWVKEVTILVGTNLTLELKQGLAFLVNGISQNLPFKPAAGILAYYTVQNIEVRTSFGLHVKWNGHSAVDVILPANYKEKVCGLCGNFNENPDDDWTTGDRCPPGGKITENNNEFGQSWAVDYEGQEEDTECEIDCEAPPPPDDDKCTEEQKLHADEYCQIIFSEAGAFKDCVAELHEGVLVQYRNSCIYDLCITSNIGVEVCATAADFVRECQLNYRIEITGWRSQYFCSPDCKDNEVYRTCGKPSEQVHCVNISTSLPDPDPNECEEGCICPEGFMISGTDCVKAEECGCLYEGSYYQPGEVVLGDLCSKMVVCNENKTLEVTPAPDCESYEVCSVQNGVMGCYCKDGFRRTDEGNCTDDHCYKNNCTANSRCVSTEEGYDCVCKMGFTGLCNSCEDVDECATNTDECDGRAVCSNTIGSYQCFCETGLIALDGTLCTDKDECSLNIHDCDENAQCVNIYKSYECICCLGYQMGENGTCVEVDGDQTGGDCCACVGENCNRPGPVCGSDFVTYASERDLVVSSCLRQTDVTLEYRGECKESCSDVECEGWKVCRPDSMTGLPTCICEGCTPQQLEIKQEVCDSQGNFFMTECEFRAAMCITESDEPEPIPIERCSGIGSGVGLGPWSEWSPCSVTCGKGERERTRDWAYGNPSPGIQARVALRLTTECYEPPCEGPCQENVCKGHGEECVEYDGVPQCECPPCTNSGFEPVCASMGNMVATYLSACKAQRAACTLNLPYEILYNDSCGVKPKECTRMPLFASYTEGDCYYPHGKLNRWTCDGGCGRISTLCCDSDVDESGLTIELTCRSGGFRNVTVSTTSRCFCREED